MNEAPRIWTRRPKIIEPRREIALSPRLAGLWRLRVRRPDGRVRHDTGWFHNLITDVGLNLIGTSQSWVQQCAVGSGNAAPAFTDTVLNAPIAQTGNRIDTTSGSNQGADRYAYARATFRFNAGTATGNLAEIGIFTGVGNDQLFSRALILDGGGSPTTITVLADEVLDATYEVRSYPPLADLVTTMTVNSTEHDVVLRTAQVGNWDVRGGGLGVPIGWAAGVSAGAQVYPSTSVLGAVTGSPSGTAGGATGSANFSYGSGSYFRDFQYSWDLTVAPSGGVAAVQVSCGSQSSGSGEGQSGMYFQLSVDPVIPKTGSNNLVLNFRQSWARRSI